MDDLTKEDYEVIFDVLNVYDPNDIQDVYPEMGEKEFLDEVRIAWHKVLELIKKEELSTNTYDLELDNCTKI